MSCINFKSDPLVEHIALLRRGVRWSDQQCVSWPRRPTPSCPSCCRSCTSRWPPWPSTECRSRRARAIVTSGTLFIAGCCAWGSFAIWWRNTHWANNCPRSLWTLSMQLFSNASQFLAKVCVAIELPPSAFSSSSLELLHLGLVVWTLLLSTSLLMLYL